MELKQGTLLHGGTYRIEQVLGQGSFGITYLAVHTALDKKVAIKEFFMKEINGRGDDGSITGMSDGSLSMNYARKFQKEALNLSRLEHPNIVRVTDSFEDNGTFYYVMDYIEGENLNEYVKHNYISRQEAVDIIRDVAKALMYMHEEKHMLHLDLKPGNIMRRSSDGHIFLIDFGLSKHYSSNGQPETSTTIGLGTAGYAPIEQANQAKSGEFRPTIDVYALGATFYKLLTRETPPAASELVSDNELLANNLKQHNINSKLSSVVVNAMLPSVRMRTQSVKDFLASLDSKKKDATSYDTIVPPTNDKGTTINNVSTEDETITISGLSFDTAMSYYNKGQYETAFPILEKLADNGSANAMFRLGVCYYWDEGVKRSNPKSINFSKCFELMSKAASKGNTDAMLWLGSYLYSNGEGVSKDEEKVVEYTKKAADANNDSAKITLGTFYLTGENVAIDEEKGSILIHEGFKGLLKRAAFLSREEMHVLATCYQLGIGVEENIQKAIYWYKKSAELGDPEAQNNLGLIYLNGSGVPENKFEALRWFKLSSRKYLTGALKNTGDCYYAGWGTSQDFYEAILWYKKAAEEGDIDAMVSLGICYKNGQGTTKNYKIAEKWFLKAKNKTNNGNAINCLGLIYEEGGHGIVKDQAKATRYYKEAALLDIAAGQFNYGVSLIYGEGIVQNVEAGIEWISKAADQDFQEAIDFLNDIENSSEEPPQPVSYAEENPRPMQKERNESGCVVLFLIPLLIGILMGLL